MESQEGRGANGDSGTGDSCWPEEARAQPKQYPLGRAETWGPLPRPGEDEKLLPEEQVLGDERFRAARTKQPSDGAQQANKQ